MSIQKRCTFSNSNNVACLKFKLPRDKTTGYLRITPFREAMCLWSDAWVLHFTRYSSDIFVHK